MHLPSDAGVRQLFRDNGVVVVRDFLDPTAAATLAHIAISAATRFASHIRRSSDEGSLDYRVVTGDVIKREAAPLYMLYESADLLAWIRHVTMTEELDRSSHLRSAININVLDTAGQQYRWHNDAVPFTVLLFLTTLPSSAGGEFLIRTRPDEVMTIPPAAGHLVLMDGRRCAHAVAPLRADVLRVTVPMVFPAVQVERPAGLDEYLYSETGTRDSGLGGSAARDAGIRTLDSAAQRLGTRVPVAGPPGTTPR